jgi:hypothetical protein
MVLTSERESLEEKKMAFVIDSLYNEMYVIVKKTNLKPSEPMATPFFFI